MPAEKRENCDASVCIRVFLRRGRGPFCGQKLRPPPPPSSPKNFFPGLSCVRRSTCDTRKNVRMITKKDPFHPSGCVVYQTGSEGLRDVIGDVCLLPVPGPSPKSSAISFRVVTLTRLTPKIKKAAGNLPQPWYLVMASGHLRLIHARNGRQNARYRLRPGNHRSGLPRSPAAVPKRCSADAWSSGGCRPTGPHAGASLRPPHAPDLPRR